MLRRDDHVFRRCCDEALAIGKRLVLRVGAYLMKRISRHPPEATYSKVFRFLRQRRETDRDKQRNSENDAPHCGTALGRTASLI